MDQEDLAFMDELKAAEHLKPRGAAQLFLLAVAGFFACAVFWAAVSEVDERVRGAGQVMPSSDLQVVQSLEGGIVTEILIAEGDRVKKDQVLLRIDDVQFASEGRGIEAQLTSLQAKQARLKAEAAGKPFSIGKEIAEKYPDIASNEEKLYASRQKEQESALGIIADEIKAAKANISEVSASIGKFARSKTLLEKELAITRRLVAKKAQPEIEQLKLERELNEAAGNLATASQARESLQAKLAAAEKKDAEKKASFRSNALGELNDVEMRIAAIRESLTAAKDKVSRTELRAPVDGIVHKLYVKTEGGVMQPAERIAEIVPVADDLMIRARISPSDVAFLKPGQKVRVSITAYDPQIYGTLDGNLERIGADTVEDSRGEPFFEIDVRTTRNYLGDETHPLPISPGMVTETEVITGKRSILDYLLKPVRRAKDRAFTEK